MSEAKNFLNENLLKKLFEEGVCLTYNHLTNINAQKYVEKLLHEYWENIDINQNIILVSKHAKMSLANYNPPFHFFSNGVLIHSYTSQTELNRAMTMITKRGYEIKVVYGPKSNLEFFDYCDFMKAISKRAILQYPYISDFIFEPLPSKEVFAEKCFENGALLLNLEEDKKISKLFDNLVALFDTGFFVVPRGSKISYKFKELNTEHIFCEPIYVPQEYIAEIYKKAKELNKTK